MLLEDCKARGDSSEEDEKKGAYEQLEQRKVGKLHRKLEAITQGYPMLVHTWPRNNTKS